MNIWEGLLASFVTVLLGIYDLLGNNFGLAIILFTLVVRLITHPFTVRQLKSTAALQDLQKGKKWQDMQKKHKGDKEKLAQAQMKLYQEAGVSPFGSCLPTLLQFPIIIALYQAIIRALATTPIQLLEFSRLIPSLAFLPQFSKLIPLNNTFLFWDLSLAEKDQFIIPGLAFGIPILAIVVVLTSYLQSKLMTPMTQPGDQGAGMGQMMSLYMPLMLGYFAYAFSAGLALYFLASNLFTIGQYAALGRLDWDNILPAFLKERLLSG
jgi:YidC/Oxa1 family membrane protein insertase